MRRLLTLTNAVEYFWGIALSSLSAPGGTRTRNPAKEAAWKAAAYAVSPRARDKNGGDRGTQTPGWLSSKDGHPLTSIPTS